MILSDRHTHMKYLFYSLLASVQWLSFLQTLWLRLRVHYFIIFISGRNSCSSGLLNKVLLQKAGMPITKQEYLKRKDIKIGKYNNIYNIYKKTKSHPHTIQSWTSKTGVYKFDSLESLLSHGNCIIQPKHCSYHMITSVPYA